MLSENSVSVLGRGFSCGTLDTEMSTLSMRAPGIQATMLDTKSLRVRGVTTTLDSVRRSLFGCTDREENRRFLEKELAHQLELNNQRWGFDFAKETPLPGPHRYVWQIVPASAVPKALRNATMAAPKPTTPTKEAKSPSPEPCKHQKRITDFLKPRKRLSTSGKKSPSGKHEHLRPPKVARLSQTHFKRTS